jgi:succinate-semialdehyde dehydrogenase / glutarate-semialdehyde dehydrogenase
VKTFENLTDHQLEEKIVRAALFYETWRNTSYAERAVIVTKADKILHDRADELAHLATLETGKRIS